jgi:hypothetical protein
MQPGDSVRILAPFAEAFPGVYPVAFVHPDGTVAVDVPGYETPRDFAPEFVELA